MKKRGWVWKFVKESKSRDSKLKETVIAIIKIERYVKYHGDLRYRRICGSHDGQLDHPDSIKWGPRSSRFWNSCWSPLHVFALKIMFILTSLIGLEMHKQETTGKLLAWLPHWIRIRNIKSTLKKKPSLAFHTCHSHSYYKKNFSRACEKAKQKKKWITMKKSSFIYQFFLSCFHFVCSSVFWLFPFWQLYWTTVVQSKKMLKSRLISFCGFDFLANVVCGAHIEFHEDLIESKESVVLFILASLVELAS